MTDELEGKESAEDFAARVHDEVQDLTSHEGDWRSRFTHENWRGDALFDHGDHPGGKQAYDPARYTLLNWNENLKNMFSPMRYQTGNPALSEPPDTPSPLPSLTPQPQPSPLMPAAGVLKERPMEEEIESATLKLVTDEEEEDPPIVFNVVTGEYTGKDSEDHDVDVSVIDPLYKGSDTRYENPLVPREGYAGRMPSRGYIKGGTPVAELAQVQDTATYGEEIYNAAGEFDAAMKPDLERGAEETQFIEDADATQRATKQDMVNYFADPMVGWWLGGLAGDAVYSSYLNKGGQVTKKFLTNFARTRGAGLLEVGGMSLLKRFGPRVAGAVAGTTASPVGTIAGLLAPELIPGTMDFLGGENNPDELRRYMTAVSPTDIGNMVANHEVSLSMPNRNENPHDRSLMKFSKPYEDYLGHATIGVGHLMKRKDQSWESAYENETNPIIKRVIAYKSGNNDLIANHGGLSAPGEGREWLTTLEIDEVFAEDLHKAFDASLALGKGEDWGFSRMGHTDDSGVFQGSPRQAVIVDMTFNMGANWWAPKLLTVQAGDTIEIIAERNGITVEKLVNMNLNSQKPGLPGLQKVAPDKPAYKTGDATPADSIMEIANRDKYGNTLNVGEQLVYNQGWPKFLEAMKNKDYDAAADEMIDSAWYHQTKNRAKKLVKMMRSGYFRDVPGIGQHGRPGVGSTIYDQADRVFNRPLGDGGVNPFLQTGVDEGFSLDPLRAINNAGRNLFGEDGLNLPAFRWNMLNPASGNFLGLGNNAPPSTWEGMEYEDRFQDHDATSTRPHGNLNIDPATGNPW